MESLLPPCQYIYSYVPFAVRNSKFGQHLILSVLLNDAWYSCESSANFLSLLHSYSLFPIHLSYMPVG